MGDSMADAQNAALIRAVLDGEHLQFRSGGEWVDCGGDAQSWLTLLVLASTRNNRYQTRPTDGVTVPLEGRDG
jgi:hypothetical protein